jgi:hypothetical protein
MMALISEYTIVTYERKPDHWRAAIIPNGRTGLRTGGIRFGASSRQMTARRKRRPSWQPSG